MKTIPAQEIKRRGISAADALLTEGHVYVILTQERYNELAELENQVYLEQLKQSLADVKADKVSKFKNVEALMKAIEQEN